MKKLSIYIISFVFLCFILPVLLTKKNINLGTKNEVKKQGEETGNIGTEEIELKKEKYEYLKYENIKLLDCKNNNILELPIDEYLYGVVAAEMPANFNIEALKAQAIVARTYTIYKILNKKHENADICSDSSCCQAWILKDERLNKWEESKREENWNKICRCVDETSGKVITYDNKVINAFFHSNSGGITELPINVWGGNEYPYLQSVQTVGEEGYSQYYSENTYSKEELIKKLREKYSDINIDFNKDDDIKILEYTEGNRVRTIKIGNYEFSGVEIRLLLNLKSTNFEVIREGDNIKFSVKGYGHGVGMSQTGADSMAKNGSVAEEIIKHFYTGVEIKNINEII